MWCVLYEKRKHVRGSEEMMAEEKKIASLHIFLTKVTVRQAAVTSRTTLSQVSSLEQLDLRSRHLSNSIS